MGESALQERGPAPFNRGGLLAVVLVGFTAFIAMLYFIGAGDTGHDRNTGSAHGAANGLNGYAGLAALLDAEGYDVERARGREGLETTGLLILTPPPYPDAGELARVLQNRQYIGPTIVILPKWATAAPPRDLPPETADDIQEDWVQLGLASAQPWTESLPAPFTFTNQIEELTEDEAPDWQGFEIEGELPTKTVLYAEPGDMYAALVVDGAGHVLALNIVGEAGTEYYENAHRTLFVVEPDLVNNYGLADPVRAAAALALVQEAGYGDISTVTFDLTLNGLGESMNLLTLAFQPPFLAATLCLILAMVIVGWRAFLRFGPAAADGQDIQFGKQRLVMNAAGLIVRARRMRLLADPYVALSERRLGHALGLARTQPEAIDAAIAVRLPEEEPYSHRAARLRGAGTPMEILRAAQALDDLTRKLSK
jgi:hypothetical protein